MTILLSTASIQSSITIISFCKRQRSSSPLRSQHLHKLTGLSPSLRKTYHPLQLYHHGYGSQETGLALSKSATRTNRRLVLAQIAIDSASGSQPASDNTVSFRKLPSLNNPGDAVQDNMVQVAATSPSPSPNQEDTQPPKQVKHQCPYLGCLKTFSASGTLKTHLAIHTKERPFKCEVCPASYTTSNRLTVHVRGHSGERPYQCEVFGCGYRAKQKCSLRNHAVKHLNAEEKRAVYLEKQRRIPCNDCGRFYKTFESLDQHCWRVHQRGAPSS
ncbi:hypothetical protein BDR26DRAFT_976641 [Obelidium mucronatum]|nr:hypothetical protein BDR26DRAFT_976641 [Obelidium mucronatum]